MGSFGIGQSVRRFEDGRLLRGRGRFHDDLNLPGQAHAVVVRSVHAHARVLGIDTAAALAAPGVVAVLTGADLARAGLGTMRTTLRRRRPDGSPMFAPPHRGLSTDHVRYVGDPIALVVAETRAQAEDAAELVAVAYEPLPSVTATAAAIGGPAVWDECPDNVSNVFETGDRAATEAAFARAARVVRRRYVISRVHAQYLETRGALGVWDPGAARYTLHADVQYPHRVRNALAAHVFDVPESDMPALDGVVHGLRDAARRHLLRHDRGEPPRAHDAEPARRQGRRRGGHGGRAARRHECRAGRARAPGRPRAGHAGDGGARVGRYPGGGSDPYGRPST
jgi:carbon-monoxide dehydrogenase large subunit